MSQSVVDRSPAEVLFEAFEEDHRILTRGLSQVLTAVREGDISTAISLADELDMAAGPHIEFEEEVFYPALSKGLGPSFVNQLYSEHASGRKGLKRLLDFAPEAASDEERQQLIKDAGDELQVGLEHALSCGTLLSQLESLRADELDWMTETLEQLKAKGQRWTERPDVQREGMEPTVDSVPQ